VREGDGERMGVDLQIRKKITTKNKKKSKEGNKGKNEGLMDISPSYAPYTSRRSRFGKRFF
jgi:hypothetical protein